MTAKTPALSRMIFEIPELFIFAGIVGRR